MRLKDLRWYILASIIVIISYAAISMCYYLSIKSGKVEQSMKAISLEIVKEEKRIAEHRINELYYSFVADTDDRLIADGILEECDNNTSAKNYLHEKEANIVFDTHYNVEGIIGNQARNQNYFFYFLKKTTEEIDGEVLDVEVVARVRAVDMFAYTTNNLFIFTDKALEYKIAYSNIEGDLSTNKYVENVLGDNLDDILILDSSIYNNVKTIADDSCVVTAISLFDGFYIGTLTSTSKVILGVDWVKTQALIFFIAGVIVVAAMLGILILGCRRASQLLRADRHSAEATKTIVIRVDNRGKVIFTNKTFKKLYGITRLNNVDNFIDVETNEPIMKIVKENKAFECSLSVQDEVKYLQLNPIYISKSYYLMGSDITIDYLRRKHLEQMCGKNDVTNCDNGFILSNQYNHILIANLGYDLAFIEYNINKFNEIISIFGRTNYNILLQEFLTILQEVYKDYSIYHMTESKFIVIYPNSKSSDVTNKVLESLDVLKRPITVKQNNIYVYAKVVVYNLKSDDFENVGLEEIKTTLDLAYRNMGNLTNKDYLIYDKAMDAILLAADQMEDDIETGLANNEFEMYLQPQLDIIAHRVVGFEALIRWNNPKYKDKSPQQFIEIAEQRGHMLDIGRFVLDESFRIAKELEEYNTSISVNVSPIQLLQVGFVNSLLEKFRGLNLKPGAIAIEITETLLMGNFQLVFEKLKLLRDAGFKIHLDDFCTGYSSMLYLKDLPVDAIKIDREFTKYIENDKTHENIVKTICSLGNGLNLGIVCEGVENQTQADMIKKMGCRVIQGYLVGRAMPFDEALVLIKKYNKK